MAPIKFEEQLKDKLEQRRIQPSSNAWKKLNSKLDANEEQQSNKGFWRLGIAATIVGVLLAVTFVFKTDTEIIEPIIVDTVKENTIEYQDFKNKNSIETNTEIVVEQKESQEEKTVKEATKNQVNKTPLQTIIKKKQDVLIPNLTNETVAQIHSETKNEIKEKHLEINKEAEILSFEEQKVNEVVAQLKKLKKENVEVSEAEIDALLKAAEKEITMQKLYNEATKTVDADALLRSVEDDLEQSFRDKVFNAITSGYQTVKTAVANRNN